MTLTAGEIEAMTTAEFFRVAWHHTLHFETGPLTSWAAVEAVLDAEPGAYGYKVADALEAVFPDLSEVVLGREFSGVIYAVVPFWDHQMARNIGTEQRPATKMGRPLTLRERHAIAHRFVDAMRAAEADELHVLAHRTGSPSWDTVPSIGEPVDIDVSDAACSLTADVAPYRIRAWWD